LLPAGFQGSRHSGLKQLRRPSPQPFRFTVAKRFTMFNRGNIPNPFSSSGQPSPQGYSSPNQAPPRYDSEPFPLSSAGYPAPIRDDDVPMTDAFDDKRGHGGQPPQQMPSRMPAGQRGAGPTWTLHPRKSPNEYYTFGNL